MTAAAFDVRDVRVTFGGVVAVDQVSLTLGAGQVLGIIGPNGAGKSTLLDVMAGARRANAGEVFLGGDRVTHERPYRRARRGLARTFQRLTVLPELTVFEHVLLGYAAGARRDSGAHRGFRSRATVERAARRDDAPLSPRSILARFGLEALADEPAGGQPLGVLRLLDLARALACRPTVLLLDEPVSGLSEVQAERVGRTLLDLYAEHPVATVVVEHNLEFAAGLAQRLLALDFGKVIAAGEPRTVLGDAHVRSAYFGADDTSSTPAESAEEPAMPTTSAARPGRPQ
jgi:branched-chain amino acid transport system ATP-binding protein